MNIHNDISGPITGLCVGNQKHNPHEYVHCELRQTARTIRFVFVNNRSTRSHNTDPIINNQFRSRYSQRGVMIIFFIGVEIKHMNTT